MKFRKYQHIARYGRDGNCRGIENGLCFIFPKIDGTNCQTYIADNLEDIKCGSRNMELNESCRDRDTYNGFYDYAMNNENIRKFHMKYKNLRLYGEWLVPHTIETYRDNAWKKFYVFDVLEEYNDGTFRYLSFDEYLPLLLEFNLDYVKPIIKAENFNYDKLLMFCNKNTFLIEDGKGVGEGIVIKRYDYKNPSNNTIWAKLVLNEFKELNAEKFGHDKTSIPLSIEEKIVRDFLTQSFIEKEYCKLVEENIWNNSMIPVLFKHIETELLTEEINNIIEEYNHPIINFTILRNLIIDKIKETKKDLFK